MESGHVSVSIVKGCFETPAWAILPGRARCHSNHTISPVQSTEEITWTPAMSRALLVICMQINYRSKPNLNLRVVDWADNGVCCKFMSLWWRALLRGSLQDSQRLSGFSEAILCVPEYKPLTQYTHLFPNFSVDLLHISCKFEMIIPF